MPLSVWGVGSPSNTMLYITQCHMGQGLPLHQVASQSIQPFGHNRHGWKSGVGAAQCCAPLRGNWVPILHVTWAEAQLPTKRYLDPSSLWSQQTCTENWAGCAPFGGGAGSPSNTMWPGPRPTSTPSGILIYPTISPQYTNITDRQDRTGQSNECSLLGANSKQIKYST